MNASVSEADASLEPTRSGSRIVVNDYAGHPFQIQLSNELTRRGDAVTHAYCVTNVTPHGRLDQESGGPSITGISTGSGFEKYSIGRRLIAEIRYGLTSARLLRSSRADVCLNSNVPIASLAIITLTARLLRIRNVLWLQDFQAGLVALSVGERHPAARIARRLERWCVRRADHVVAISDGFEREVRSLGAADRVTTIPNWAPIDELPVVAKDSSWSVERDLDQRVVFLYSGTLGLKHRPEALIALARRLQEVAPEALVLVVSESAGVDWIESQRTDEEPLSNVRILPFQPFEALPAVLGAADVLVALLEEEAGEFSVPSKVLTYLCAQRPVLGLMPAENAASQLVVNDARAGLVACDVDSFLDDGERFAVDPQLRSDMGHRARRYAESTFAIERIAQQFLDVLIAEDRSDT
ncbi:MAG: glycosyltransferase family 4 protein [Actinomycetota bacterium]